MSDQKAQDALLRHFVASGFAFDKPDHVAVAVSGGGDSIALLCLMAEWAAQEKVRLQAVTVNHGLREEAAAEARFAAETAHRLKVKHTTLDWKGWKGEGNLQDAARRARYRLMAEWAKGEGISTIALAHTADDQAETFFMRLGRASGIDGLTGMQRRRQNEGVTWVRPLLMQTRDELRSYLKSRRQVWIDDPSNDNEEFDRIKARKAMDTLTELGVDVHVVGRVMDHLGQVRSALDFATHDHAIDCITEDHGDLIVDRALFSEAAPEINRRLLSHCLRWISSADYGPRGMKLQEFLSALTRGKDATLHGVRMIAGERQMRLVREYAAVEATKAQAHELWDGRWFLQTDAQSLPEGEIRALGEAGLSQIEDRSNAVLPRESLLASPALFEGEKLIAAPHAGVGELRVRLHQPKGSFYTALLSH